MATSGDILGFHNSGGAGSNKWVEARDAANVPQGTGQSPTTKTYLASNRHSAETETSQKKMEQLVPGTRHQGSSSHLPVHSVTLKEDGIHHHQF